MLSDATVLSRAYRAALALVLAVLLPSGAAAGTAGADLKRGDEHAARREHAQAIAAYTAALKLDPKAAAAYRGRAASLLALEEWDRALADAAEAIALAPKDALAHALRAGAHLGRAADWNNLVEAERAFADADRAARLDPQLARALYARGLARTFRRELKEALADCEAAVKLSPQSAEALHARGQVHEKRHAHGPARRDYDEALRLDPAYADAYLSRAGLSLLEWDLDACLADLDRARRGAGESARLATLVAQVVASDRSGLGPKELDRLLADCDRAVGKPPARGSLYLIRAVVCLARGETDRALADCGRALELAPGDGTVLATRAHCHMARLEYDRAAIDLTAALKLNPLDPLTLVDRADAYLAKGETGRARADLAAALKLDPDEPELLLLRGALALARRDPEAAAADFAEVLRRSPKNVKAQAALAELHLKEGRHDKAVAACDAGLKVLPREVNLLVLRGAARAAAGQKGLADADFAAALRLDRKDALRTRGELYLVLKRVDAALADLDEAVRLDPKSAAVYLARSEAHAKRRDRKKELADLDEAIRLAPGSSYLYVQRGLARLLLRETAQALTDLAEALRIDPEYVLAHSERALVWAERRQFGRALADCDAALRADPECAAALLARAEVYTAHVRAAKPKKGLPPPVPGSTFLLSAGAPAPDLSRTTPVIAETFDDPARGPFARSKQSKPDFDMVFEPGKYLFRLKMDGERWIAWGDPAHHPDLACEAVARLHGQANDAWGILLTGKPAGRALWVRLRGDGRVQVVRAPWAAKDFVAPAVPLPNRVTTRPIGEFNTLLVILRGGRLEIYVNGAAACAPVALPPGFETSQAHIGLFQERVRGAEVAFRRFSVWHTPRGTPAPGRAGHVGPIGAAAFSPDGRLVLTGGGGKRGEAGADFDLCLWDADTGSQLRRFAGHTGPVLTIQFLPDGRRALSAAADDTVRLWDLGTGKELRRFEGRRAVVGRDGSLALVGRQDGTVRLLELATGKERSLYRPAQPLGEEFALALKDDGKLAAAGGQDGTVHLWDPVTGKEIRRFSSQGDNVTLLSFRDSDGRLLTASTGRRRMAGVWDVATGAMKYGVPDPKGCLDLVAASARGRFLVGACATTPLLTVWKLPPNLTWATFKTPEPKAYLVAVSPDGRRALTAHPEGRLRLWNLPLTAGRAHADLDEAIRLEPQNPAGHVLAAQLYLARRLPKPAEAALAKALEVDPKCVDAYFERALIFVERNRLDNALADLTRTIDLDPWHAEALFLRGTIYTERGDLQNAKRDLDRAFELRPDLAKRIPPGTGGPPKSSRGPRRPGADVGVAGTAPGSWHAAVLERNHQPLAEPLV
jgi:tetratricopeptide (TPR) repeat protein